MAVAFPRSAEAVTAMAAEATTSLATSTVATVYPTKAAAVRMRCDKYVPRQVPAQYAIVP